MKTSLLDEKIAVQISYLEFLKLFRKSRELGLIKRKRNTPKGEHYSSECKNYFRRIIRDIIKVKCKDKNYFSRLYFSYDYSRLYFSSNFRDKFTKVDTLVNEFQFVEGEINLNELYNGYRNFFTRNHNIFGCSVSFSQINYQIQYKYLQNTNSLIPHNINNSFFSLLQLLDHIEIINNILDKIIKINEERTAISPFTTPELIQIDNPMHPSFVSNEQNLTLNEITSTTQDQPIRTLNTQEAFNAALLRWRSNQPVA